MFKSFAKNLKGRDFCVGDIHGNFHKLQFALDNIKFNKEIDRLFSVGDIVDYGLSSGDVMEWLGRDWFFPVMGNHEEFAIRHARSGKADNAAYRKFGGGWFIDLDRREQEIIVTAFERLPLAIEVETNHGTIGIVHADSPYSTWAEVRSALTAPNPPQSDTDFLRNYLLWSRDRIASNDSYVIPDLSFLLVGHNVVPSMCVLGNVIYLDTGASYTSSNYCLVDLAKLESSQES